MSDVDIELVDPELRAATEKLPTVDAQNRAMRIIARGAMHLLRAYRVEGVTTRIVHDGAVRARIYRPDAMTAGPALLWIHGGGFVVGLAKQDDRLCAETAAQLGITVVSAEYRLAPETPFPGPLDDVTGVWEWLRAHAHELDIDPARVVIGGESAGAGLAAALVQRLHDTAVEQPIAEWLFCPMLDDRTAARRELDGIDHWIWNNTANHFGWASYLGEEPGAPALPDYAAPARREDLTGLPATWLCVGDIELFHDEDVDYARRLAQAGVDVTLDIVPGAPHGFENWAAATAPAQRLLARARAWLAEALGIEARAVSDVS